VYFIIVGKEVADARPGKPRRWRRGSTNGARGRTDKRHVVRMQRRHALTTTPHGVVLRHHPPRAHARGFNGVVLPGFLPNWRRTYLAAAAA
jgi:hypothetical protein